MAAMRVPEVPKSMPTAMPALDAVGTTPLNAMHLESANEKSKQHLAIIIRRRRESIKKRK